MQTIVIESKWGEEKKVLQYLNGIFSENAFLEEDYLDLKTAVAEACLNAMEHGNRLNAKLTVYVAITYTDNVIMVDVCDEGTGFSRENHFISSPGSDRGWGLLFIHNLVDEWNTFYLEERYTFGIRMHKRMRTKEGEITH